MLLAMLITSLLVTIALGSYVLLLAPNGAVNRAFAAFAAAMALWTAKDILYWVLALEWFTADAWVGASLLLALGLQLTFFGFAHVFPERSRVDPRAALVACAPLVLFVPLILAGALWERAGLDGDRFAIRVTPWMWAYGAYVLALLGAGLWTLARKRRAWRGTLEGKQLAVVLALASGAGVLMLLVNVVLPLAGPTWPLTYSSLIVLVGALGYAYAIGSVKLFSIASVLDPLRLFPLTSKIALIIGGAGLLGFLVLGIPVVRLSFGPRAPDEWERFVVLSVMTGLIPTLVMIALIVRAVSRPVRRLTEAAVEVTRGRYGTQVAGLRSNDEIGVLAEAFNEMSRRVAADIEQLQTINEGLVRTEKLATAGVLAAGVAHEVNNPLASISSLVQVLQKRAEAASDRETFETILGEISRISAILRDLTEFARAPEPRRKRTAVNPILEACLRLVAVDRRLKALRLEADLAPELPDVLVDPDQMQQVFLNLILNAADATPEGGSVRVATREERDAVVVEVADTGRGIAPEIRRRVFDPFFTTKPPGRGTGLGLSVCYGIVSAHGGEIDIESEPGEGTTVRVRLPVASGQWPVVSEEASSGSRPQTSSTDH
jgi:signal transduction histidine kinase